MQLWRPELELDGISLDTRKFVFSNRVVDSWNSLSAQLTHLRSMFQFDWSRNPVAMKCDM